MTEEKEKKLPLPGVQTPAMKLSKSAIADAMKTIIKYAAMMEGLEEEDLKLTKAERKWKRILK